MNKKIFTLLASTLMLFFTAVGVNAQPWFGPRIDYLPNGLGKGAYHIKVTHFGETRPAVNVAGLPDVHYFLILDSVGKLEFVDETYFFRTGNQISTNAKRLREALWCVNIHDEEILGKPPTYNFINKEYNTLLAVDSGRWIGNNYYHSQFPNLWSTTGSSPAANPIIYSQFTGNPLLGLTQDRLKVYLNGEFANWRFSETYNTTPLQHAKPFLIEIPDEPGWFMTFASQYNDAWTTIGYAGIGAGEAQIELVKVHARDLEKGAHFYEYSLVRFELVEAAPRVLTAADFNSRFGTQTVGNSTTTTLRFDEDVKGAGVTNVFAQGLRAYDVTDADAGTKWNYMYLRVGSGTNATSNPYVYVADGDTEANYYSEQGLYYPIIKTTPVVTNSTAYAKGQNQFRMVYHPSYDSLIINVKAIDHIEYGEKWDGQWNGIGAYGPGKTNAYYNIDRPLQVPNAPYTFSNRDILWDLTVRMQDLVTAEGKRVITVADYPTNALISFGIGGCALSNNRTTVPRNLYLIRDQLGRYLVMPLEMGDFTPQWIEMRNNEDPMKTPSYQWLVYPQNEESAVSAVTLVNREFDWVRIEYSTIYSTPQLFNGRPSTIWGTPAGNEYNNVFGNVSGSTIYYSARETDKPTMFNNSHPNYAKANDRQWNVTEGWRGSFLKVQDDVAAAAKKAAKLPLTQDDLQKLYRTNEFLGYKYIAEDTLSYFTYSFNHLHAYATDRYLGPKPSQSADTILYGIQGMNHFELVLPDGRQDKHGTEKYGIGWVDNHLEHPSTKDIAPLERYYYHFKENNYWDFVFNNNFVVLAQNRRYAFAPEITANILPRQKSAFYIRFMYQPPGKPEYYTLIDRIHRNNLDDVSFIMGEKIATKLKVYDYSHDANSSHSYPPPVNAVAPDSVGILALAIDDNTAYSRAYPKVLRDMISAFAVSNETEPLYRRFNEGVYIPSGIDAGVDDGGERANDDPRLIKIYREWNEPRVDYLYEDAHSVNARDIYTKEGRGINYLSWESIFEHNDKMDKDPNHFPHNFSFYLDTAYVNRGTGHIKPQYLIVVGPQFINRTGCYLCDEPLALRKGVYGRFLINATDSARGSVTWDYANDRWNPNPSSNPNQWYPDRPLTNTYYRNADYIWDTQWDRLVFVPAIHIGDSLFLLKGGLDFEKLRDYGDKKIFLKDQYGEEYLSFANLVTEARKSNSLIQILPLGNNLHKDYVFSMRFYERYDYERFLLESETTNRISTGTKAGRMIAPMEGGWVKDQNGELVISRGSYSHVIRQAERFNTEPTTDDPVANDRIDASAVKVIAGDGIVTILNAAGKRVTISNILGQTVAGSVLSSDNATIAAPKGVLVVAVEGENAVKAVVK